MTHPGPMRVLMVGRHYWPHLSSDVASRTVRLADGLARSGIEVEVLTPRFASTWPTEFYHREIRVHRPAAAPRSDWSMGRYLRHLESWLREHAAQYDVLYSATMREEAAVVVEEAKRADRIAVLHHAGAGIEADYQAPLSPRFKRRVHAAWQRADAVIVSRAAAHQHLLGIGLASERIARIANGIVPSKGLAGREEASRERARRALAAVNGDLATDHDSKIVLSVGSLSESSGTMALAQAIPSLVNLWPDLRFWLIGDGPQRNELHRYFKHHGVRQNVAMPGTFTDLSDIMHAVDVYVQPSLNDSLEEFLLQAIAAPLPVVMADGVESRALIGAHDDWVSWCSESQPHSMYQAIRRVLLNLVPAQSAAENLRRAWLKQHTASDTVQRFVQLLCQLTGKRMPAVATIAGDLPRRS